MGDLHGRQVPNGRIIGEGDVVQLVLVGHRADVLCVWRHIVREQGRPHVIVAARRIKGTRHICATSAGGRGIAQDFRMIQVQLDAVGVESAPINGLVMVQAQVGEMNVSGRICDR